MRKHTTASNLPIYPSMQACEAATGIPKSAQQQAKRAGCDAFDAGNRVHLEKLLRFLFRGEDGGTNWPDRLKRAQALIAEKELAQMEGDLVEIAAVHEQQAQCVARAVAVLVQKFETELPPKQDGMPAARIAELNRAALDEVRAILAKRETYAS